MSESEPMLADVTMHGHVAVVWMCDGRRRNALSRPLIDAMLSAMEHGIDRGARAIVIASRVSTFCAGGDLEELLDSGWMAGNSHDGSDDASFVPSLGLAEWLSRCPLPVVAAVDGMALGGGFEFTLLCDAVIAGPNAVFALPETGLGLAPCVAISYLPEIIGRRATLELVLTRRKVRAEEAMALGIVGEIVASENVVTTAVALAASLVDGCAPASVATVKRLLRDQIPFSKRRIGEQMGMLALDECREGIRAFRSRQKPDFEQNWATARSLSLNARG